MKPGGDVLIEVPGAVIIHQKIRAREVSEHAHDGHEFFLPLQGEIRIRVQGRELKAGPGKMIYLPPDIPHSFESSRTTSGERLILILSSSAWRAEGGGKFAPSLLPASQLVKEVAFHLLIHPRARAARALVATLVQVLSELLESPEPESSVRLSQLGDRTEDPRVQAACEYIRVHATEEISVDEVARAAGLSVRNLNRLMMIELGASPKKLIVLHRIDRARRLLKKGRSVTDVAMEVGYSSVSQFIATFRRTTGQLPSDL